MSKMELGATTYLFPMPATLVGTMVDGKINYRTIAYCSMVQIKPAVVTVAIGKGAYTSEGIKKTGGFSVNIPSGDMAEKADYCGLVSGREKDKSALFTNFFGKLGNVPMIEECPINLECRLIKTVELDGDHEVFFGEIVQTWCNEEAMNNGKPAMDLVKPLIFSPGDCRYWNVGECLGKAWSIGKKYSKSNAD